MKQEKELENYIKKKKKDNEMSNVDMILYRYMNVDMKKKIKPES